MLGSGTASATTFLRGDQTWAVPSGGSSSFGSNSNSVGSANAPGASSSNARADHVHQGVHQLTSNGSNALFENVNVAAGSGIALGVAGTAAEQAILDDLALMAKFGITADLSLAEFRAIKPDLVTARQYVGLASPTAAQTASATKAIIRVLAALLRD
jgi:hypothetical protein